MMLLLLLLLLQVAIVLLLELLVLMLGVRVVRMAMVVRRVAPTVAKHHTRWQRRRWLQGLCTERSEGHAVHCRVK